MARRTKRLWTDEEKRRVCLNTTAPRVCVALIARRDAMNADMLFNWLRDPRLAPTAKQGVVAPETEVPCFLPFKIIDPARHNDPTSAADPVPEARTIKIDVAGGHRLRISEAYDPDALARLLRGLSGGSLSR